MAITFWYGGTSPGLLAALLSALVRSYLFEAEIDAVSRGRQYEDLHTKA